MFPEDGSNAGSPQRQRRKHDTPSAIFYNGLPPISVTSGIGRHGTGNNGFRLPFQFPLPRPESYRMDRDEERAMFLGG